MEKNPLTAQRVAELIMTLPPDRLASVYEFVLLMKQQPVSGSEADVSDEAEPKTMTREAVAEYRVDRAGPGEEMPVTVTGTMVEALYDGAVLRLAEPLTLAPNTRVWVTIETTPPSRKAPRSFLATARSLNLEGPADWSANLERYLYEDRVRHEG